VIKIKKGAEEEYGEVDGNNCVRLTGEEGGKQ
jgi:hypothetical protein